MTDCVAPGITELVTSVPTNQSCERSSAPGYNPGTKMTYQTHGRQTCLDLSQVSDFETELKEHEIRTPLLHNVLSRPALITWTVLSLVVRAICDIMFETAWAEGKSKLRPPLSTALTKGRRTAY
jgi:hypothetical protein